MSAIASGKLVLVNFSGEVLTTRVAADDLSAVLHRDGIGSDRSAIGALRCSAAISHDLFPSLSGAYSSGKSSSFATIARSATSLAEASPALDEESSEFCRQFIKRTLAETSDTTAIGTMTPSFRANRKLQLGVAVDNAGTGGYGS